MRLLYYIIFFLSLGLFSCKTQTAEKTETFKVWGNCEKCKATIESSIAVDGITEKNWDTESTLMTVKFDTTKITLDGIQQLIA
jgi:copper chaperone CopZ